MTKKSTWSSGEPPRGFVWSEQWHRLDQDQRERNAYDGIYVAVTGRAYLNMQQELKDQARHLHEALTQRAITEELHRKRVFELERDLWIAKRFIASVLKDLPPSSPR